MNRLPSPLRLIRGTITALVVLVPLFALAQDSSPPAAVEGGAGWPRGFTLGPGDVLSFFVWEQPRLSRNVAIAPDGTINYPLIGEIHAQGRSVGELHAIVADRLKAHLRNPQVTVSLEEVRSYRIFVIGEVLRPGVFELTSAVTVVQALAMAGGFTPFASRQEIIVYNPFEDGGQRKSFDYNGFVRGDVSARDMFMRPRDTVIVK